MSPALMLLLVVSLAQAEARSMSREPFSIGGIMIAAGTRPLEFTPVEAVDPASPLTVCDLPFYYHDFHPALSAHPLALPHPPIAYRLSLAIFRDKL